jgi:hypothetical protein
MRPVTSLLIAAMLFLWQPLAMALEEPEYTVAETFDDFELRHYPPYLVAEVDVQGNFDEAGNDAFRILAGYIFGENQSATKMSMTAPVESRSAGSSEKMAMTAPVTAVASDESRTTFAFVMERKYTVDTLPVPNDRRVRIRKMPDRIMAVRRYSGRWTEDRYVENLETLRAALAEAGIETVGEPILARYNSPFSLPIMRRNEVMLEVESGSRRRR